MSDTIQDYEWIDRFFNFELDEQERERFEERLQQDPLFAERVRLYRRAEPALAPFFAEDKADVEERPAVKVVSLQRRVTMWVAAVAAVLLLAVFGWKYLLAPPVTPQMAAADYWGEADKSNFILRSTGDQTLREDERVLNAAAQAFTMLNYPEVLLELREFPDTSRLINSALLLRGAAEMEMKRYPEAIATFEQVLGNPGGGYRDQALWYAALAETIAGRESEAQVRLRQIVDQQYPQAGAAAQLLEKMR